MSFRATSDPTGKMEAMEIGTSMPKDEIDYSTREKAGMRNCKILIVPAWVLVLMVVIVFFIVVIVFKVIDSEDNRELAPYTHTHDLSFPGMNDNTTLVESCPARLIVEVERSYSLKMKTPFALFLFDSCGSFRIENHMHDCDLAPELKSKGANDGLTIPDWIQHCIPGDLQRPYDDPYWMFQVHFWYDQHNCPADHLFWINSGVGCDVSPHILAPRNYHTISLWNNTTTAKVIHDIYNKTTILIPDQATDSCWEVECGRNKKDVSLEECIQHVQKLLRQVSLEEYVNRIKHAQCEPPSYKYTPQLFPYPHYRL